MFKDRAEQFHKRLNWDVNVDENGEERDAYDNQDPIYIVIEGSDGSHEGSMRLLPMVGRNMYNDHFSFIANRWEARDPLVWECTRFCVSTNAGRSTSALLLAAGGKFLESFQLRGLLGVFDARMERVYRLLGSRPKILGRAKYAGLEIGLGFWRRDFKQYRCLLARAGISAIEMEDFFAKSNIGMDYPPIKLIGCR